MDVPDAILDAILRASTRRPTPAGIRSGLHAALLAAQRQLNALQPAEDLLADLPEPPAPVRLKLAVNEQWCRHCGAVVGPWMEHYLAKDGDGHHIGRISTCCRAPDLVTVADILPAESYYIAN